MSGRRSQEFGQPKRRMPIAQPQRAVKAITRQQADTGKAEMDEGRIADAYGKMDPEFAGRQWSPSKTDKVEQRLALTMADVPGAERMSQRQWEAFCDKQIKAEKEKAGKKRKPMDGNGLAA